jgi:hypothetical protein
MDQLMEKKAQYLEAEKLVYQVLTNGSTQSDDIGNIAKLCNLTDFQVGVAMQLLQYKNMLPEERMSQRQQ